MASAYHIFQNWKLDQITHDPMPSADIRHRLQTLTQMEVSSIYVCTSTVIYFFLGYRFLNSYQMQPIQITTKTVQ